MPARATPDELGNPGYELFIMALSCLSIVNVVLLLPFSPLDHQQTIVVFIVDSLMTLIFLTDFTYRSLRADSFRGYFFHERGWLDLLGSMPLLRIFRIFRVLRVARLVRKYGFRTLWRWVARERAQSALFVVVFLVLLVLEVSSLLMLPLEARSPDANITTGGDALWWGIVTVTTVGYGDYYPVTTGGRTVGVFVLLVGVGLFGTFTGFLANAFLAPRTEPEPEPEPEPEADAAAPATPRDVLADIRRELAEQEAQSASLRRRLEQLESTL
jgi:voltage-gated potassium channel